MRASLGYEEGILENSSKKRVRTAVMSGCMRRTRGRWGFHPARLSSFIQTHQWFSHDGCHCPPFVEYNGGLCHCSLCKAIETDLVILISRNGYIIPTPSPW